MPTSPPLTPILEHLRTEPSRTWSLIVTLYGDAILPRGGTLALGTVLEIFEALGIGGNVVRTAMSRLTADGWLERIRVGRNAYYRLADKGRGIFAEAARRIYQSRRPAWDGAFHLAVLADSQREAGRTALERAGYAPLAPGVMLAVTPLTKATGEAWIPLRAMADPDDARRLARQIWLSARLEAGYRRFLESFTPLRQACAANQALSELEALLARLLLVHEYRRLVLHDPLLPDALLPREWPGQAARELCAEIYPALLPGSERWLDEHALAQDGRLPAPLAGLDDRFQANPKADVTDEIDLRNSGNI